MLYFKTCIFGEIQTKDRDTKNITLDLIGLVFLLFLAVDICLPKGFYLFVDNQLLNDIFSLEFGTDFLGTKR